MKDLIFLSFKNLLRRKLRSWLTTLGVIIGISSVMSLISISIGMQKAIEELLSKMGKDKLIIFPGQKSIMIGSLFMGKSFSEKEVEKIEKLPDIEVAVPYTYTSLKVCYEKECVGTIVASVPVETSEKLGEIGFELKEGREFKKGDKGKCVAILGYLVAKKVFSKEIKVGDKIKIGDKECKVIGIFKQTGSRWDDLSIIIPYSTMKELFKINEIKMIIVKAKDIEKAQKEIEKILRKTRGEDFTIMTMGQLMEYAKQTLGLISLIVVAIAGISIVVSGIGIMNTMYMAVTERIKEIGLLKALGARNYQILILFLFESGFLGMFGGIIGCIIGIILAKIVEHFSIELGYPFKAYIDPFIPLGLILFAFFIGIISGILPAYSAARINPVKALRSE